MSDRITVATRKGLFFITRSDGTWQVERGSFIGDEVTLVLSSRDQKTVFAALNHGHFGVKLHRSSDGGETFHEIAAPTYPPKPEGLEDIEPARKIPVPWAVQRIWELTEGHPDEPGVLWCGTIPGGLFKSSDGGESWALVRSLWDHEQRKRWSGGGADFPGLHSVCVDPRDPKRVTAAVSLGGVWASDDGGESWTVRGEGMRAEYMPPELAHDPVVQDPHRLVQCAAAPDNFWVQHHNGIFRSTDDCHSWTELEGVQPSSFGFAVAVHPRDPNTAWFVPGIKDEKRIPVDGKLVVTRTRDGGASVEALDRGLPQAHAYDLVYRHALDVDASGERLAFGGTTGNLFVSEDQGDSWTHVSAHLPPILAVRFG